MVQGIIIKVNGKHKHFTYDNIEDIVGDNYDVVESFDTSDNYTYLIIASFDITKPFNKFDLLTCNPNGDIYIITIYKGSYTDTYFHHFLSFYTCGDDIESEEKSNYSNNSNDDYDYTDGFVVRD